MDALIIRGLEDVALSNKVIGSLWPPVPLVCVLISASESEFAKASFSAAVLSTRQLSMSIASRNPLAQSSSFGARSMGVNRSRKIKKSNECLRHVPHYAKLDAMHELRDDRDRRFIIGSKNDGIKVAVDRVERDRYMLP